MSIEPCDFSLASVTKRRGKVVLRPFVAAACTRKYRNTGGPTRKVLVTATLNSKHDAAVYSVERVRKTLARS
jgi:hypothetical protein